MENKNWQDILTEEFEKDYFKKLKENIDYAYRNGRVYPPYKDIFKCFKLTRLENVKIVIIGQDPYHEYGQANGLCFSVNSGVKLPPSLLNIYKEIEDDLKVKMRYDGNLEYLARQGVFLLNALLTVKEGQPMSFANMGWETFNQRIIEELNNDDHPKVFLLWGAKAREKAQYITNPKHLVLQANHPSPLSAFRGFFGCKHFSKANDFLIKNGLKPIKWDNN